MYAHEAPYFGWLHKSKNCAFSLIRGPKFSWSKNTAILCPESYFYFLIIFNTFKIMNERYFKEEFLQMASYPFSFFKCVKILPMSETVASARN